MINNMHRTADGNKVLIKDMGDNHLLNTIKLLERKASEGTAVRYGGGVCAEDIWYDEDVLFGKDALNHLNYDAYKEEADKRKLLNSD